MDTESPRVSLGVPAGRGRFVIRALAGCLLIGAVAGAILEYSSHQTARRSYRIGWEIDPPEQLADANNQPTGLAVELVREAARRRGIALQWVRRDESSEAALRSGAVDLWPLMTITAERLKVLHISAPYLDSAVPFMVRRDSRFRRIEDLSAQTIGYLRQPFNPQLIRKYVPEARLVARRSSRELIVSLCNKEIDAAFIEQDEVIHDLMTDGAACGSQGFTMITPPGSRIRLGIGSTIQASAAADAIREEIDSLSADGWLADLFARWGYLSGRNVSYVDALRASRQREQWTRVAAGIFALLFLLALGLTWRYFRESKRARRAESALLQSTSESRHMEERLRLLAHALWSANDCISIADTKNRILFVNQAFLTTYEYDESELMGQPVEILRSSRADRVLNVDVSTAIEGENWRGEIWNRSRSGREFPVSLATSRVRDEQGNFIAMVGVASDISARRKAEEEFRALQAQYLQAQKLESVGQLAGGVAHDFNNLLTVIMGYSKKLRARIDSDHPFSGALTQISVAADRAAVLTRQLLTFSRRSTGTPKTISLDAIVTGIEPMLRRLIEENIEMILVPEARHEFIFADPGLMEQVIVNLVVNARDAMPDGGRLFIETSRTVVSDEFAAQSLAAPPGVYVSLVVTDTGT
jgi:PAS domain S-box-containing protein